MRRAAASPRSLRGRAVSCIPDGDQSDLACRSNMRRSMAAESLSGWDQSKACPVALEFELVLGTVVLGATQYRREPALIARGHAIVHHRHGWCRMRDDASDTMKVSAGVG